MTIPIILTIVFALLIPFGTLYLILQCSMDWTKEKELLLWYTEYIETKTGQEVKYTPSRKFIKLFKL